MEPTQKLQRTNNKIIMEFHKQTYITAQEKFKFTSHACNAPGLYGQSTQDKYAFATNIYLRGSMLQTFTSRRNT